MHFQELSDRRRLLVAVLIMIGVAAVVAVISGWVVYRTALEEERAWMLKLVQSQARLIESIARFHADQDHASFPGDAAAAALSQVTAAHARFPGFGETGEFVLGRREGDRIVFLLDARGHNSPPQPVEFDSARAEPMRLALTGRSGTMIGLDYRDVTVLAAHEPVAALDLGIVAKIDLAEVRAPFLVAGLIDGIAALIVLLLGGFLVRRVTTPILHRMEGALSSLNEAQRLANLGNWEWDMVKNTLTWSDEVYRIFGAEPQAFGATYDAFLGFVHPDDRTMVEEAVNRSVKERLPYAIEHRVVRPDGSQRIVHEQGEVVYDRAGTPLRMRGTVQDITERQRADEVLRMSEQRYRSLVEQSPYGIFVHRNGAVIYANPAGLDLMGADGLRDLVGTVIFDRVHPDFRDTAKMWTQQAQDTGHLQPLFEYKLLRLDGGVIDAEANVGPTIFGGEPALQSVIRDITSRKTMERALAESTAELARSNADLEQFAYVASHDLQEPLRTVASFTQLLAEEYRGKMGESADKYIDYVVGGAKRMQVLINDLLGYSRVGTRGKPFESTDCTDLVARVVASLNSVIEETWAQVEVGPLPTVTADPGQLMQVFQNLIANALRFRGEDPPLIRVEAREDGGEWVFSVKDNGIGIDPQFFDRVFVMFKRLHGIGEYEGSGVGLAIVKKVVERHGGRVWVESNAGEGATFFFTMPRTEVKSAHA